MPDHRIDYVTAQRDYDQLDDPSLGDDGGDADSFEQDNCGDDDDEPIPAHAKKIEVA